MGNVNGIVAIVGIATEGQTLTVRTTGISDADGLGTFSYQWLRDGVNITNATNTTYSLTQTDVTKDISVKVSYTDVAGNAEQLTSSAVYAASNDATGTFIDSGQSLGESKTEAVTLGDIDNDGDLDVVVANWGGQSNKVYKNNGTGTFTDSGQSLGSASSSAVSLGDVDADGDLDMVVANGSANKVWTNDGTGTFTDSSQIFGASHSSDITLGDIDGDGDLDIVVANRSVNKVYTNVNGTFTDSGQSLGSATSWAISLGDLDGDGDLDMVVGNNHANKIYLNDNAGIFTDSGQSLGSATSSAISLGDLDADGDLDMVVANYDQPDTVWTNDGTGTFTDSGQSLGSASSGGLDVTIGDIDSDGDLDMIVSNLLSTHKKWLNDGAGDFTNSTQLNGSSLGVILGDIDADGDLDMILGKNAGDGIPNLVYFNNSAVSGSVKDTTPTGTTDLPDVTINLIDAASNTTAVTITDGIIAIAQDTTFTHVTLASSSTHSYTSGVSLSDVGSSLRHVVGMITLTGEAMHAADIDNDGTVSLSDVGTALRHVVGMTSINTYDLVDGNGALVTTLGLSTSDTTLYLVENGDVSLDGAFVAIA